MKITPAQRRYLQKLAANPNCPITSCRISHLIEAGVLEMRLVDVCNIPGQLEIARPALTEAGHKLVASWSLV